MSRRNPKGRRKETEAAYAEMACATQETGSSLKRSWVPLVDFDVTQYQTLIFCTFKKGGKTCHCLMGLTPSRGPISS